MKSSFGSLSGAGLALSCALSLAGCGESFIGAGGAGGAGASGGSTSSGTTQSGGGGSTSTMTVDCQTGSVEDCYEGPTGTEGKGICKAGTRTCANNTWGPCEGQVVPQSEETCDGVKDDDCDGALDNGCDCAPQETKACYEGPAGTKGVGPCVAGLKTCTEAGVFGPCEGQVTPSAEVCNAADDDCNGTNDDVTGDCETNLPDGCQAGKYHCSGNTKVCVSVNVSDEICDGLDNDCNGDVDETFPEMGDGCSVGVCQGTFGCPKGQLECIHEQSSVAEICGDGKDNDCDGVTDPPLAVYLNVDFADDNDWTLGTEWEIGPAKASMTVTPTWYADPSIDHTPVSIDNMIAGVVIGGDTTILPHAGYYLTSPVVDVSDIDGSLVLSYFRWLNSDAQPRMTSTVEVWNGSSWVTIWQNGGNGSAGQIKDNSWVPQVFDVTPFKSQTFQVRFGVAVAAGVGAPASVSSWNLDDVRLTSCTTPPN